MCLGKETTQRANDSTSSPAHQRYFGCMALSVHFSSRDLRESHGVIWMVLLAIN